MVKTLCFLTVLFYVWTFLKILHIIDWNWRWVTAPLISIIAAFIEAVKLSFSKEEIEKILKATRAAFILLISIKVTKFVDWNWLIIVLPFLVTLLFVAFNIAKSNNPDYAKIIHKTVWFLTKSLVLTFLILKVFKFIDWNWLWIILSAILLAPCLYRIMIILIVAIELRENGRHHGWYGFF